MTIALRTPTVVPDRATYSQGHCYILFAADAITVKDLIAEKVRAELRKARAGGWHVSSVKDLVLDTCTLGFGPLDEQIAIRSAHLAFLEGRYMVVVNNAPMVDLNATVVLTKQTVLAFVIPEQVTV